MIPSIHPTYYQPPKAYLKGLTFSRLRYNGQLRFVSKCREIFVEDYSYSRQKPLRLRYGKGCSGW